MVKWSTKNNVKELKGSTKALYGQVFWNIKVVWTDPGKNWGIIIIMAWLMIWKGVGRKVVDIFQKCSRHKKGKDKINETTV